MFERSPEIPNFGTTNPFRCRHVVTKFPQLDLRTPAKEGSQRLTKAYPRPALDLTMAPWGIEQHPGSLGHDMSWPKIDRKIQKLELALEALLALGSAGLFWLKHTEMMTTLRLAAMDVALQKVLASRSADTA
jgi:hypothetical protein